MCQLHIKWLLYLHLFFQITHPAGCFAQFMNFFGNQIFVLWKYVLLQKRIVFFSPPPIGVVCFRGKSWTACGYLHKTVDLDWYDSMWITEIQSVSALSTLHLGGGGHSNDKRGYQPHPWTHKKDPKHIFLWLKFASLNKYSSGIWHPKQGFFFFKTLNQVMMQ